MNLSTFLPRQTSLQRSVALPAQAIGREPRMAPTLIGGGTDPSERHALADKPSIAAGIQIPSGRILSRPHRPIHPPSAGVSVSPIHSQDAHVSRRPTSVGPISPSALR